MNHFAPHRAVERVRTPEMLQTPADSLVNRQRHNLSTISENVKTGEMGVVVEMTEIYGSWRLFEEWGSDTIGLFAKAGRR